MSCDDGIDPGRVAMKEAIKKTLLQFDVLSKQLEVLKKDAGNGVENPLVKQLESELSKIKEGQQQLKEEFDKMEENCRRMILDDPDNNVKKIRKLYAKLEEKVKENMKYVNMADKIKSRLSLLRGKSGTTSQAIKEQYKT
ncbi:hypothetical protein GF325_03355, partial [Candidatus Bathyarchaeota archaeon]|nr:hypothetical protein [Candidatus Bathyarchaeota archaeon]